MNNLNKTQMRILKVLERIGQEVTLDVEVADVYSETLQEALDALECEDFFGTDGATDPRGDQRDGPWSMNRVQEVDK